MGPAFRLLLDGIVPFGLQPGRTLADRVLLSKRDVRRITSLFFSMPAAPEFGFCDLMPQGDALEVLNAPGDASHLLRGLPYQGRNPRLYSVAKVCGLAAKIVTIAEIALALNTDPATAWQELRRRGLVETAVEQGAWPRSLLLELS